MTANSNDYTLRPLPPRERTSSAMALDNLVRRKLRVSNPTDSKEVAQALRAFYTGETEALQREAAGLPFFQVKPIAIDSTAATTATRVELVQAKQDVERDLAALIAHPALKDVQAELRGWRQAIEGIVADGTEAARFGLDPRQRDAAMAARRQLGAYARLARYVGTLTPNMSLQYRQLAKSLDEVAALIVVSLGDSIAVAGTGGGRFLLQAPASELQSRRDAVIHALRNLTGTSAEAYGPNDWPRGLIAVRQFVDRIEEGGHTDLRILFQETYVARALDELVHYATGGSADDLRALAATAAPTLERFRRLILLAYRLVDPESPPLAAYLGAIQFFLDAFEHGSSGTRLLYVSRPPIVFYGLYGNSGVEDAGTRRLLQLVMARGQLAEALDCYLGCDCGPSLARCQIVLDKILYDVDRAIDLYLSGVVGKDGPPEQRAAAYGVLIHHFLLNAAPGPSSDLGPHLGDVVGMSAGTATSADGRRLEYCCCRHWCVDADIFPAKPTQDQVVPQDALARLLVRIRNLLWWARDGNDATAEFDLPQFKVKDETDTAEIIGTGSWHSFYALGPEVRAAVKLAEDHTGARIEQMSVYEMGGAPGGDATAHRSELLSHIAMLNRMHQELCMQRSMEEQWDNLLRTMAPNCIRFLGGREPGERIRDGRDRMILPDEVLAAWSLLNGALEQVRVRDDCSGYTPDIPPHYETSLAGLTYGRYSEGDD